MTEGEISIGGALSFAWSLLSHHWRAIWGILALNALSWTVLYAGGFAGRPELIVAGMAAVMLTKYALYGAVFRLGAGAGAESADNPDLRLGALGIQWKRMEFRLVLADLLVLAFMLIIAILVILAMMAVLVGVMMANGAVPAAEIKTEADMVRALGPYGPVVMSGCQTAVLLLYVFLFVRLFLAWPASALSGSVAVLRAWRLTRPGFFMILVSYMVVQIPVILTQLVMASAINGQISGLSPVQILGYSVLSGLMSGAASMPLTAGLQAYFYKMLGPVPPPPSKGLVA